MSLTWEEACVVLPAVSCSP